MHSSSTPSPATGRPTRLNTAPAAPSAAQKKEASAPSGRQVEPTEPLACASLACALPQVTESELPWFEQVISRPPRDISARLLPDPCISSRLQDPETSIDFYKEEVAQRQQMKAAGREYTFAPFLVTLHNMLLLTENILDGQQFAPPLSRDDHEAFLVLRERIEQLIAAKGPYRRTIELTLLMACMLDVVMARYLLPELHKTAPELFSLYCIDADYPATRAPDPNSPHRDFDVCEAQEISLHQLLSCAFGTLNPGGQDENRLFFYRCRTLRSWLPEWLDNPHIMLYPTFALRPQDRCRISHLPVYPLEMTAAHALNVGRKMLTPRALFKYGLDGVINSRLWERQQSDHPLEKPASRLQLRHWALDLLPACLQEHQLERAVTLVMSHILCPFPIDSIIREMASDSFLLLYDWVDTTRKHQLHPYCTAFQAVSDWQAVLACLWVHRLYKYRQTCPESPQANRAAQLGRRFARTDMPALVAHWRFLHDNWQVLRQDFLARADENYHANYGYDTQCRRWSPLFNRRLYVTSRSLDGHETDSTTLVYLDALHDAEERAQMARATGKDLPDGAF